MSEPSLEELMAEFREKWEELEALMARIQERWPVEPGKKTRELEILDEIKDRLQEYR